MTAALILNIALAAVVVGGIVGMLAWAIRSAAPAIAAPAPVQSPRVREHAVRARARAAHADRARAARAQRSVGRALDLGA
ncbi:MAG: hypothetical protein ABI323_08985 [Solirubrobacteraceae bacterium]